MAVNLFVLMFCAVLLLLFCSTQIFPGVCILLLIKNNILLFIPVVCVFLSIVKTIIICDTCIYYVVTI